MLIFDSFPSKAQAKKFASSVANSFQLASSVHNSQESSDEEDPFPSELSPPIVLVERGNKDKEIIELVSEFGGSFAGT